MADKEIAMLPASDGVTDDTLIPVYQPGALDPAQKMTGGQFRAWAEHCAKPFADQAAAAAGRAEGAADQIDLDAIKAMISQRGNNLEYDTETGLLHLLADGERIGDGVKVAAGGGGGGGGGTQNNAVISMSNKTGWIYKTIAYGSACPISFAWSSLEEGIETGPGVLKITVNSVVKATMEIQQGEQTIDIWPWLDVGMCAVKFNVTDLYGNSRTLNFNVTTVQLTITSSFDSTLAYEGSIPFTYTPTGYAEKTVHFIMDGDEIGTATVSTSGRQQSFTIPAQSHGAHTFEVFFDAVIDGATIPSNRLRYRIICLEAGNTTPVVAMSYWSTTVEQLELLNIPYVVYDPEGLTASITLKANGEQVGALTVDRTQHIWSYRPERNGELELSIQCGDGVDSISFVVTPNSIDVEAETNALALYLNTYGRSNNEDNPATWVSGDVSATLTGFNFTSDGWQLDENGVTVLRVGGQAHVEIPYKIFKDDSRSTGKTIEVEFATRDVMNYDAPIITCYSGGRGLNITAQKAVLSSEQSAVDTQFKENERVRLAFVIEKNTAHRLLMIYINGILSGAVQYPTDDDFSQLNPVGISIGSPDATVDMYCIRVYDNDLTRYQVLDNWIADTPTLTEKAERFQRNDIYDDYGKIVISKLPEDLPYMVLTAPVLPQYKGNKVTVRGSYTDLVNTAKSYTFEGAEADVQGTSSAGYARKNYKIKFKGGFIRGGVAVEDYQLGNSVPTNTFTFKADVASSEGANNVELVKLYCDICPYQTPPQLLDKRVRQGIDGYPIVIFHDNGESVTFVGKYNYNHDKGTPEVFGMDSNDESWETKNNTNDLVRWKSADFTAWTNDYEARHPEDNTNVSKLRALAEWVVSTDPEQATNGALAESKTYGGVTYTADTAEYRLAKFDAELGDWFDEDSTIFYYLFTELFLMVDSRVKNSFPTLYDNGKWCWLPYDMDTAIGINNEGALAFGYALEDTDMVGDATVYNGQDSVIWNNLRRTRRAEIEEMYQSLRSNGLLTYENVVERFENHQSKWPEAIFNEDAFYKYLEPLFVDGTGAYLSMLQGSKAEQRKWWLYNRFRYIDSKYNAGDAVKDFITLRGYAKSDITVTPYADIYAAIKFGSVTVQKRALRGDSYLMACPLDVVNDTETYIYSASQLADIGDLSGYKVGYADFSMGTKLQAIKVGDSAENYSNPNLNELYLGNNTLLKVLDVRNCPNLGTGEQKSVDISGCTNIEEVYFTGTSIAGLTLPNGGILKTLHLPGTMANLTIRNQPLLSDFQMPGYGNITTLRLENVSDVVPTLDILNTMPAGSRVRLIGFSWALEEAEDILALYDKLDTMVGLDENGLNTAKAQLSGTIYVPGVTNEQLAEMMERYPSVTIAYGAITKYRVRFWNGDVLLQTVENINYGAAVNYSGGTPVWLEANPEYHKFVDWDKMTDCITKNLDVYAVFRDTRFKTLDILDRTISGHYENALVTKVRGRAFHGCKNLTSVRLPNAQSIGANAFNSSSVEVLTLDSATVLEREALAYSSPLKTISVPKVQTVGDSAFARCTNLEALDLPEATEIAGYAIAGCTALRQVSCEKLTVIGGNTFNGCTALESLIVPSVTTLSPHACGGLISLTRITLPSLQTVGAHAFAGSGIADIILPGIAAVARFDKNAFGSEGTDLSGIHIYVHASMLAQYQNSLPSVFVPMLRTIEDYPEITGG